MWHIQASHSVLIYCIPTTYRKEMESCRREKFKEVSLDKSGWGSRGNLGLHSGYFWASHTWNAKRYALRARAVCWENVSNTVWMWQWPAWDISLSMDYSSDLARQRARGCFSFPHCPTRFPPKDESLNDYSGLLMSKGDVLWLKPHRQVHFLARAAKEILAPVSVFVSSRVLRILTRGKSEINVY